MKYNYDLVWKSFNINIDAVDAWVRANYGDLYLAPSADYDLTLHFSDKPDDATLQHIQDYWDGLDESSTEATSYVSQATIRAAIDAARADVIAKTWDQLSTAQKKLLAGLTPTRSDLGL